MFRIEILNSVHVNTPILWVDCSIHNFETKPINYSSPVYEKFSKI